MALKSISLPADEIHWPPLCFALILHDNRKCRKHKKNIKAKKKNRSEKESIKDRKEGVMEDFWNIRRTLMEHENRTKERKNNMQVVIGYMHKKGTAVQKYKKKKRTRRTRSGGERQGCRNTACTRKKKE